MDGGVQLGTHVLKALSVGAKAVGVGRHYLLRRTVGVKGVRLLMGRIGVPRRVDFNVRYRGVAAIAD